RRSGWVSCRGRSWFGLDRSSGRLPDLRGAGLVPGSGRDGPRRVPELLQLGKVTVVAEGVGPDEERVVGPHHVRIVRDERVAELAARIERGLAWPLAAAGAGDRAAAVLEALPLQVVPIVHRARVDEELVGHVVR